MEALTLVQTGKTRKMPIILVGSKFWGGMVEWFRTALLEEKVISPEDMNLIQIIDEPEAWSAQFSNTTRRAASSLRRQNANGSSIYKSARMRLFQLVETDAMRLLSFLLLSGFSVTAFAQKPVPITLSRCHLRPHLMLHRMPLPAMNRNDHHQTNEQTVEEFRAEAGCT